MKYLSMQECFRGSKHNTDGVPSLGAGGVRVGLGEVQEYERTNERIAFVEWGLSGQL